MPLRFCGDVVIFVYLTQDNPAHYFCRLWGTKGELYNINVGVPPDFEGDLRTPEKIDGVAHAALIMCVDDFIDLADDADSGIENGHYVVHRKQQAAA